MLLDRRKQHADEDGDDGDHDQVTMHFQISFACPSWRPYGRGAGPSVRTVTSEGSPGVMKSTPLDDGQELFCDVIPHGWLEGSGLDR